LPILRVAEVLDGKISPKFDDYVRDTFRPAMGAKISQPHDVVLTTKGTVGRVAIMTEDAPQFVYSPQLCFFRIRPGSPVSARYLYYWFKSDYFLSQARHRKSQTDMADYINLADIKSLTIKLPSENSSDALTAVLGALDDKIAVNEKITCHLTNVIATHFLAAMRRAQYPTTLQEIIDLKYGKALTKGDRSLGPVPIYGGNGISGWHQIPLVHKPGIIVGRKGANAGSVSWSQVPFWAIDTAFYVASRSAHVPDEFLFLLLSNLQLRHLVGDSAIPGLNREAALACEVVLPASDAIDQFAKIARSALATQAQVNAESRALSQLRDTLLPRLMSGELRVRDAEMVVEEMT
ncbi:MAG: restriction endonuclease subunit S, partial [Pseudomonas fluorescens]